jgi:hypothetical protein
VSRFRKHVIDYREEDLSLPVEGEEVEVPEEPSRPSIPVPISKEEISSSAVVADLDQKCPKCKVRNLKLHERKDGARCPVCN